MQETPEATNVQQRSILPNVGDVLFITIMYLLLCARPHYLFGDGGTGWHLMTGQYVLTHYDVPRVEFLSYTFAGKPWISLYWLADTWLALAEKLGGLNLVAVLSAGTVALTVLLLYQRMRATGCHLITASLIAGIGTIVSSSHWLARPHIFAFLCLYVFSTSLEDYFLTKIGARRFLVTIGVTSLLWTNLHPSFMAGWALITIYLSVAAARAFFNSSASIRFVSAAQTKTFAGSLLLSVLMSVANPNGIELLKNIYSYLGQTKLLDMVVEYQSPVFHGDVQTTCLELLFLLVALGLLFRRASVSAPQLLSTLVFAHLALQSGRYMPLFVIVASPFIAGCFASGPSPEIIPASTSANSLEEPSPGPRIFGTIQDQWQALGKRLDATEQQCSTHATSIAVFVLFALTAMAGSRAGSMQLSTGFDPAQFPTKTLAYIRQHNLPLDAGFNEANWGGYIKYASGIPVFIDDRSAVFGQTAYLEYASAVGLAPGWSNYLTQHKIRWIIYPKNSAFANQIRLEPHWKLVDEDQAALVFIRND